jgi:hypothetical protein
VTEDTLDCPPRLSRRRGSPWRRVDRDRDGGYAGGWGWTGYPGNTLWDWVQLLLAPIAITTFVVPELIRIVSATSATAIQSKSRRMRRQSAKAKLGQPGARSVI